MTALSEAAPETADVPIVETPAPVAPASAAPARTGLLPLIAVLIAAVAALLSAIGLIVASRTVAEARVAIDALRAGAMRPPVVEAAAPPALPMDGATPLTAADLDRALVDLRRDLARAGAERGGPALAATIGGAQAELANRISTIGIRLDRIEQALNSRR
ncbi:MAG TPA: hypothetical protein VNZ43_05995 [Sphingomonadaceae bacterium]|nr:hypothetical protein [Sphingomonadaceae bacterium]